MKLTQFTAMLTSFALATTVVGGEPKEEHHDVTIVPQAGTLVTGIDEKGEPFAPERVFGAELGETGIPGFGDEPGFLAPAGALPASSMLGWNATAGLRVWDGATFVPATDAELTASLLGDSFTVHGGGADPGFMLAVQPDGGFHRHLNFLLTASGGGTAAAGVYLLELEMTSSELDTSEPFWIVFNNEATEEDHEAAEDWVRDQLAGTPCPGDLDGSLAVDFNDLVTLLADWGPCAGCPADLDGNDAVDFNDLVSLLAAWGACP